MDCLECGGPLVAREIYDYEIDTNGSFFYDTEPFDLFIVCSQCGISFEHEEESRENDGKRTISLPQYPKQTYPATIVLKIDDAGVIVDGGSDVSVLAYVYDTKEMARIQIGRDHDMLEAARTLAKKLGPGEWKVPIEEKPDTNDTEEN